MESKLESEIKLLSPEQVGVMSDQEMFLYFEKVLANPQKIQMQVLMDILKESAQTKIGKRYQFEDIKTIADFQNKVPISEYDDYKNLIEEIAEHGSEDLLFPGKTKQFIATSGTTGKPKLFPESQKGSAVKAQVSKIRAIKMMMMAKEVMAPEAKLLAIANPAAYGETKAGIKIGSASGQAASDLPPQLLKKMVLPVDLLLCRDLNNETIDYLTMFYMMREENLVGVVSSNIAHFELLLDQVRIHLDELTRDIEAGNFTDDHQIPEVLKKRLEENLLPDPSRAEKLRQTFLKSDSFPILEIWPGFTVIACWQSSSTGRVARSFKSRIPEKIRFLEWGYGASEGKFNIPDLIGDPAGPFADFGYFFEFLPLGSAKPKLLHELEENKAYELIITSYSGLYRYNLKDIIWVKEIKGKMPRIQFLSKASEKLIVNGRDIFAYKLDQGLDEVSKDLDMGVHFYEVMFDQKKSALRFFIEPLDEKWDTSIYTAALEEKLQNMMPIYRKLREENSLHPLTIMQMANGYRNKKIKRSVMPGKNVNQTKLKTIIEEIPDNADFAQIQGR
ncbi:MAG: hypothetical protein PWP30_1080 [Eubacteriaceae bacterium]|nr:hypothetical protein [Eubacteriaceae bacterium]